jgi:hypothetical protein
MGEGTTAANDCDGKTGHEKEECLEHRRRGKDADDDDKHYHDESKEREREGRR